MKIKHQPLLTTLLTLTLASPTYAAQYIYDDLNRLMRVIYPSGKSIDYTYDPGGNLLTITTTGLPSYTISGQVTDSQGQPLPNVLITLNEYTILTDEQGHYQLTDLPAGDYTLIATKEKHNFTPQTLTIPNQSHLINLQSDGLTQCLLYAVHDESKKDTQFFTIDPTQNFSVKLLGQLHAAKDIEALDSHPTHNQLFAAAGDDGTPPGALYTLNAHTGKLYPVNNTGTGFNEINGLSFHPDGSLWAWAEGDGLIMIETSTGLGTLIYQSNRNIEDLTWDNSGTILYIIEKNQLLAYSNQTGALTQLNCQLPGGKIEALEMLPNDQLLFAIHQDKTINIHALDPNTCQLLGTQISTQLEDIDLNDIEGIAWPIEACSH